MSPARSPGARQRRAGLAALLLGCLVALPAAADDAEALRHTEEGDRALKARRLPEAAGHYRAALTAEEGYLPARLGLGEALLAAGDSKAGIQELRRVLRDGEARAPAPAGFARCLAAARARLREVDPAYQEWHALKAGHVADLCALAERHKDRDPDLALRALERALAFDPDDERARGLLARLTRAGARTESLFDGRQIRDWDGGSGASWSVQDGVLVGTATDFATFVRAQTLAEGDFDVVVEARIEATHGENPFFAVLGAWTEEYRHTRFGLFRGAVVWHELHGQGTTDRRFATLAGQLRPAVDPGRWNTWELRYRGAELELRLNGRKVTHGPRPPERSRGYAGLLVQECTAHVRRVELIYR